MVAKVQKWGNSQGVRFPKAVLEQSQMSIGDSIDISARKGLITIKLKSKIKGKYDLKDLVKQVPKDYKVSEIDWGSHAGKEEWEIY